jgi:hypothetical protein
MIEINNSKYKPNWTQLKDRIEPLSSCNVSACINAAQAAGYDVMTTIKMGEPRPADDLMLFIRSDPPCIAMWEALDPQKCFPPNQWLAILALGAARWLGLSAPFNFSNNATAKNMAQCIIDGGACVVSGHYRAVNLDGNSKVIDHITALVGVGYDNPGKMNYWIMDDSYGDYRTQYISKMGDNVVMPQIDFDTYLKEICSITKRCIFIPKKGA